MAVLFGLMGLIHGPVMSVAKAGVASPPAVTIAEHGHHAHHQPPDAPSVPTCDMVCFGLGCFQPLTPVAATAPHAQSVALEQFNPASGRAMIPALPEPADPPPRLQV